MPAKGVPTGAGCHRHWVLGAAGSPLRTQEVGSHPVSPRPQW